MAKRSAEDKSYIDVDTTILKPSPQRMRNILTLAERVAAIKAYECRPMYTKVAKMFNCSWEQIKNIIANRQAILEFYEATKNAERQSDPQNDDVRQKKIEFLGECVYEFIQRLQFHTKSDINEELIRSKAYEFRDVIQIDTFVPNKAWINHFKATYNFSLSNRQITLTRTPPASLELRDIMTYCTKQKMQQNNSANNKLSQQSKDQQYTSSVNNLYRTSTKMALSHENDATAEELRQRRQRKLGFLERALIEYVTRAKFHLKVTLDDELLCSTAATLRDMLKIDNFLPNRNWLKSFKTRNDFDSIECRNFATSTRTPPLSLDLKDILSYCSRLEKNNQIGAADTVKCQNGLTPAPMISVVPNSTLMPINNDGNDVVNRRSLRSSRSLKDRIEHRPLQNIKEEIIDLDEDDNDQQQSTNDEYMKSYKDLVQSDRNKRESRMNSQPPPLKIRKIESIGAGNASEIILPHSPHQVLETIDKTSNNKNKDELPKTVRNYTDALKLLKPLEEFAMLEENFRAIGLLEQLESIFKNPPKHDDDED